MTDLLRPRGGSERGAASAELVVATPLLLLVVLLVVQFGIWQHAVHVADVTAAQALAAARVDGATAGAGQAQARAVLAQLGRSVLRAPRVTVTRTASTVHVEVHGTAQPVLPWLRLPAKAVADGPVERFVPASQGR